MKKFFYLLALLPMTILFTACPPDPEPTPDDDQLIVGTWRVTSMEGYNLCDGREEFDFDYIDYDFLWTFYEDGELVVYEYSNDEVRRERTKYQVKGKELWIHGWQDTESSNFRNTCKITELTKDKMQIVVESEDEVGNEDYRYDYSKWTYNFIRED